ncbi:MAG: outer membrane beta-barrel protein [Chitinophagaceae bacterium]|nr:outer membrane beta-barrel protein [Chitinophagaceae bacterium]
MKRLTLLLATAAICLTALTVSAQEKKDTIRIGGMVIVKEGKTNGGRDRSVRMRRDNSPKKLRNVSTNWGILDLGFSNYDDKTVYNPAGMGGYLVDRPGYPALGKSDFKLRTGKSVNVNIWLFMQRVNLIKHHVNLKYGLGLELNNYRYKSSISYRESGAEPYSNVPAIRTAPFIFRDSIAFSKNKLAADYLTVPFMLNFTSHPAHNNKGVSLSVGVSAGYLYSQRNKQKSDERGKLRNKGDYDLERFKFSYVAELGIGPIRLYGSYSPQSMYKRTLDMRPYTIGLRFSNW